MQLRFRTLSEFEILDYPTYIIIFKIALASLCFSLFNDTLVVTFWWFENVALEYHQLLLYQQTALVPVNCSCTNKLFLYQQTALVPANCFCSNKLLLYQQTALVPTNSSCTNKLFLYQQTALVPTNCSCTNKLFLYQQTVFWNFPSHVSGKL